MMLKKFVFLFSISFLLNACGEKKPEPFDASNLKKVKFSFKDEDDTKGEIKGKISLTIPETVPLDQVTDLVVYWGSSKADKGKKEKLKEISLASKSGDLLYEVPEDTEIEEKYFLLYLKNKNLKIEGDVKTNETYSGLAIEIKDVYGPPKNPLEAEMIFEDQDSEKDKIEGKVVLKPLAKDKNLESYVLYWGKSAEDKEEKLDEIKKDEVKDSTLYNFPKGSKLKHPYLILHLKNDKKEVKSGVSLKIIDKSEDSSSDRPITVIPENETPEDPEPDIKGNVIAGQFENVLFKFNDDSISDKFKKEIKTIFEKSGEKDKVRLLLAGHADERGSNEYNLLLGERRAISVKKYLIALGAKGENLRVVSFGEEKPLDPAHNKTAWQKNRRVEIKLLPQKDQNKDE